MKQDDYHYVDKKYIKSQYTCFAKQWNILQILMLVQDICPCTSTPFSSIYLAICCCSQGINSSVKSQKWDVFLTFKLFLFCYLFTSHCWASVAHTYYIFCFPSTVFHTISQEMTIYLFFNYFWTKEYLEFGGTHKQKAKCLGILALT